MPPAFPWLFSYTEDTAGTSNRYQDEASRLVLRPIVQVGASAVHTLEQRVEALIDSGSEHTLLAPWIARALGLDIANAFREFPLGIGGQTVKVSFLDVSLRLFAPQPHEGEYIEWQTEVGFVDEWRPPWQVLLGQVGFLDRFTVTMHRGAQAVAIEDYDYFDEQYGMLILQSESTSPRFSP